MGSKKDLLIISNLLTKKILDYFCNVRTHKNCKWKKCNLKTLIDYKYFLDVFDLRRRSIIKRNRLLNYQIFLEKLQVERIWNPFSGSHSFWWKPLLDPRPRPEMSYKIGFVRPSFRPSFRLSLRFLGVGSLVFSET